MKNGSALLEEFSLEEWEGLIDFNLRGTFLFSRSVIPVMKKQKSGKIINMASQAGRRGESLVSVYCATKAAVISFTQSAGLNLIKHGINVNAICPGYIDTEINHHHWQTEQGQKLVNMLPRKRVGHPKDLDALLVMLASPQSDFINGAVIAADDGFGL